MRPRLPFPALALFLAVIAAGPLQAGDRRTERQLQYARTYLEEVQKHLRESYIEGDRLADADLMAACLDGMRAAMDHADFATLPAETREALRAALSKRTVEPRILTARLRAFSDTHPDADLDYEKLADHGARAMVAAAGDPYSHLFETNDMMKLMRLLNGGDRDRSIGLSISNDGGGDTRIRYVMYATPAFDAGIDMGDTLLAIDGAPIRDLPIEQANERLQADPGATLTLRVMRDGWLHPYDIAVTQRKGHPEDVIADLLPGKIGYLRLTIFDMGLNRAVREALDDLHTRGMRGLILDLRHNPGGALVAATAVADQFLGGGTLITYTETRLQIELPDLFRAFQQEMPGRQEYRAKDGSPFEKIPLVVLVDHASASASEMLSGALQDTGRATIIGETTYGKGVGQSPIPLFKSGGMIPRRFLYLTVMRYSLPTGRSIQGTGVAPDIEIRTPAVTGEAFDLSWRLRHSPSLPAYVGEHWSAEAMKFRRLAEYDENDAAAWPDLDGLRKRLTDELGTAISLDEVRFEARRTVRERIARDDAHNYVYDLETDLPLQTAVLELNRQMGE